MPPETSTRLTLFFAAHFLASGRLTFALFAASSQVIFFSLLKNKNRNQKHCHVKRQHSQINRCSFSHLLTSIKIWFNIEARGFPLAEPSFKGLDERCNRTDGWGYRNYPVRHLRLLFFAFHISSLLCSFNRSCHIVHCLTIFIEKFFILSLKFQSLSVAFDRLILSRCKSISFQTL